MRRLVTVLCLTLGLLALAACGSIVEPVPPCTLDRATLVAYDSQGRVSAYVCP